MTDIGRGVGVVTHVTLDVEAQADASMCLPSPKEAKNHKQIQNVVLSFAVCIATIASGGIFNSPMGHLRNTSHKLLVVAYVVVILLSFTLGLALLMLSLPHPNARAMHPSTVRKLMWISLAMVYVTVGLGTSLALMEA